MLSTGREEQRVGRDVRYTGETIPQHSCTTAQGSTVLRDAAAALGGVLRVALVSLILSAMYSMAVVVVVAAIGTLLSNGQESLGSALFTDSMSDFAVKIFILYLQSIVYEMLRWP